MRSSSVVISKHFPIRRALSLSMRLSVPPEFTVAPSSTGSICVAAYPCRQRRLWRISPGEPSSPPQSIFKPTTTMTELQPKCNPEGIYCVKRACAELGCHSRPSPLSRDGSDCSWVNPENRYRPKFSGNPLSTVGNDLLHYDKRKRPYRRFATLILRLFQAIRQPDGQRLLSGRTLPVPFREAPVIFSFTEKESVLLFQLPPGRRRHSICHGEGELYFRGSRREDSTDK